MNRVGSCLWRPIHCQPLISPVLDARWPEALRRRAGDEVRATSAETVIPFSRLRRQIRRGRCRRRMRPRLRLPPKAGGTKRISKTVIKGGPVSTALQSHKFETRISAIAHLARECKPKKRRSLIYICSSARGASLRRLTEESLPAEIRHAAPPPAARLPDVRGQEVAGRGDLARSERLGFTMTRLDEYRFCV